MAMDKAIVYESGMLPDNFLLIFSWYLFQFIFYLLLLCSIKPKG